MFECQTRDHYGAIIQHPTVAAAFDAAEKDEDIWKISWTIQETGERVRFIRMSERPAYPNEPLWSYEPMPSLTGGQSG